MINYDKNDVLFKTAETMAAKLNSLYKNSNYDKRSLLEFIDVNDGFGIKEFTCDTIKIITARLTLWLSAYKQPGRVKIDLMLAYFKNIYPDTCQLYHKFITDNNLEDEPYSWKLLDFILSEIDHDITDCNEFEIEKLIEQISNEASLESARMFSEFLRNADVSGQALTKWNYTFESRAKLMKEAYPLSDFSIMAYYVFNEEVWIKQNLIAKAVKSKIYADLWLFTALHFICALRASDMKKLPAPKLPYDRKTIIKNILDGTFSRSDACALVDELKIRLELKPMKPSKTAFYDKVPDLKLFVPESLKTQFGIIMAIALAHNPKICVGDNFVSPSKNIRNARDFFGKHFAKALGNRHFSSLRGNKSYLQGIEAVSEKYPGKPKGYMIAALARSHKGGIGSLPKTTDIYLKDANFSGYKPEFIIREMFERGVFSFIPAVLLEIYAGKNYKMLSVTSQTKLIGKLGLSAYQIEWLVSAMENALNRSRATVNSILKNPNCFNENIGDILQNIASGNAPGRQSECLCLMTAAGFPCPFPDRDSCIACGYEIYTKAAMHNLMSEYVRLSDLKKSSDKANSWRYEKMLKQAIMPAIAEMVGALKIFYKDADITGILDIVEGGLNYVDSGL